MKSNIKLFQCFQTAISFQNLTIFKILELWEVWCSSIVEDRLIWPHSGSTKKTMLSVTLRILIDLITIRMLLMIAKRFLYFTMDVKVFRSAQQKKMKKFTINLKKTSVQMMNQMNMDPTSQTKVKPNKNLKNWKIVKKMEKRTQRMMKKVKNVMRMVMQLKKLDRKDKLSLELLTTES